MWWSLRFQIPRHPSGQQPPYLFKYWLLPLLLMVRRTMPKVKRMPLLYCFFSNNFLLAVSMFFAFCGSAIAVDVQSCDATSPDASGYQCGAHELSLACTTFAVLRANSHFSSLQNLSFYLGLNRSLILKANGFSNDTTALPRGLPLLIPITCRCRNGFFQAGVEKTCVRGETFRGIAASLEGLTTCKAIRDSNQKISPLILPDKLRLLVPLRCACASPANASTRLFTYPVKEGDTISSLSASFGISYNAIVSVNKRWLVAGNLQPFTTILIPVSGNPSLSEIRSLGSRIRKRSKKGKMWIPACYVYLFCGLTAIAVVISAAVIVIQQKKKRKPPEMESLRIRTASEKKVSLSTTADGTPRNVIIDSYTIEDLNRATDSFSPVNHIEGAVFHGRLNGKDMAIKQVKAETMLRMEFHLLHDTTLHHPNILKVIGTSISVDSDPFLVLEYAANGSLKDWLHNGLAVKNQFIASSNRFLTWNQRINVCLDVAVSLQYMHQVMIPSYVHGNVKSRNIFLDENFSAKIGNFGMGKRILHETEDREFCSTDPASWTHGYLAPEFIRQPMFSPCVDIFAYGVVLLEVISGQTPIARPTYKGEGYVSLPEKIKSILRSDKDSLREWMDGALGVNFSLEEAVTVATLARACVADEPSRRPHAGEIVDLVSRLVEEHRLEESAFSF